MLSRHSNKGLADSLKIRINDPNVANSGKQVEDTLLLRLFQNFNHTHSILND